MQAVERYNAACSANGQIGGIIDESADLDQVVEDGGVDRSRSRCAVVDVDEGLQDLVRKLQPGSVKGRYVAPVPAGCIPSAIGLGAWTLRGRGLRRGDGAQRGHRLGKATQTQSDSH